MHNDSGNPTNPPPVVTPPPVINDGRQLVRLEVAARLAGKTPPQIFAILETLDPATSLPFVSPSALHGLLNALKAGSVVTPPPVEPPPPPPPPGTIPPLPGTIPPMPAPYEGMLEGTMGKMVMRDDVSRLVKEEDAEMRSVQSGALDDPATLGGKALTDGARVVIKEGHDVIIDKEIAERIQTIRVDGMLRFNPFVNTALNVDTLVISESGYLEIGSDANPVADNVTCKITITDTGPIDINKDPALIGRGWINHGKLVMCGKEVTPWVFLDDTLLKGDSELLLASNTVGWKAGDTLILPGTNPNTNEDEVLTILNMLDSDHVLIKGSLKFDHKKPTDPRCKLFVAHVTRNIQFESENKTDYKRFGHFMNMSPDVDVCHFSTNFFGRTNKTLLVEDKPNGTDYFNARARYAFHFHRAGCNFGSMHSMVEGAVAMNSPGWGFVNHRSHVSFTGCVAYKCAGAGFSEETGVGIGDFTSCAAVRCTGDGTARKDAQGEDDPIRLAQDDFGHSGFGFWLQGLLMEVRDCVAAGCGSAGFGIMGKPMEKETNSPPGFNPDRIDARLLPDPSVADGAEWVNHYLVPIRFVNNQAYACRDGLETWRIGAIKPDGVLEPPNPRVRREIVGFVSWAQQEGLYLNYSSNLILKDCLVHRDPARMSEKGVTGFGLGISGDTGDPDTRSLALENTDIIGYSLGTFCAGGLYHKIVGGVWENGRDGEHAGDIGFGNGAMNVIIEDLRSLSGRPVRLVNFYGDGSQNPNIRVNGKRLYFSQNAPSSATTVLPGFELVGLKAEV